MYLFCQLLNNYLKSVLIFVFLPKQAIKYTISNVLKVFNQRITFCESAINNEHCNKKSVMCKI